jgi:metal-sulfur cluster biosynthetic enzyme
MPDLSRNPAASVAECWAALRQVDDPELGCNIVDLGLVYSVVVDCAQASVKMTLTTPGCPMHESLASGVQSALLAVDGIEEVDLEIVWDPPWRPEMLSEQARELLNRPGSYWASANSRLLSTWLCATALFVAGRSSTCPFREKLIDSPRIRTASWEA